MIDSFKRLQYFNPGEFDHPEEMLPRFLDFLDVMRDIAGIEFHVTSDFRSLEENRVVGGSTASLHMQGRAVDFIVWPWNGKNLWRVAKAVALVEAAYGRTFELEIAESPSNRHIHLGLQVNKEPGELILVFERPI